MAETPVARFIAALKKRLGTDTDEQLAVAIDVRKSTIASWRRRGSIPKSVRDELRVDHGVDYDRFAEGSIPSTHIADVMLDTAYYVAVLRLGKVLDDTAQLDFAAWLAEYGYRVRMLATSGLRADDLIDGDAQAIARNLAEVAAGQRATVEELLQLRKDDPLDDDLRKTRGFPTGFPT